VRSREKKDSREERGNRAGKKEEGTTYFATSREEKKGRGLSYRGGGDLFCRFARTRKEGREEGLKRGEEAEDSILRDVDEGGGEGRGVDLEGRKKKRRQKKEGRAEKQIFGGGRQSSKWVRRRGVRISVIWEGTNLFSF